MNEDFLEKEGQFWLKNINDEVIGIVRNVKNKTITFDVTAEYFTVLQAQNIIEKYGKIEKEIYINFDGGYGAKKNNNGEVFLHYQTHELSKKDNYSDRGEVLETLFWMRENFYPFFDGMKNIEYKISAKIPNIDNYTVSMKFKNPTKGNTPETFSIEENGERRCYFNDLKDHNIGELTYGENYIFSQNFDSNTFLGLYTETVTKEFVDYIEKSINCNVLKTEKDFENFIESFNIASRDGEKIESININSGYENGIKFSKALPEVWVNMNNGSYAYSKKNKLIVGSSFYRENRLEQMHEIFKKVEILLLHFVFIKKAKHLISFLILLFLCLLLYFSCSVRVYLYASSKLDTSSKNNSVIDRNKTGGNHSSTVTLITALRRRFSYITTQHPL